MSNVKISELAQASSVNPDDLVLITQEVGNEYQSKSASVEALVSAGFIDITNLTVEVADWSLQSTPDYSDFPYVATIGIAGLVATDIAEVIPSIDAIMDGKLCPLNNTVANGIKIYASSMPSVDYDIERISIRGGNT